MIIDNYGCDPASWNNHGSIEKFKGQWYVFYHRTTNGHSSYRKACVEPITINPDGSIDEVKMTSQGAGSPISAFSSIEAEWACELTGDAIISDREETAKLSHINSGATACYRYLDFGKAAKTFTAKIIGASHKGQITIYLDSPASQPLASCNVPVSADSADRLIRCEIPEISGIHALYLKFEGEEKDLFEIDNFAFFGSEANPKGNNG